MDVEVTLPGELVAPLPKMGNRNRKNNKNAKPNGFICFANAQRPKLNPHYNIRGNDMLVKLCDPLWRQLSSDEKKLWGVRAKEEHARSLGKKLPSDGSLRMDCNRKFISERQVQERAVGERRDRERKLVKAELARCEEVMDLDFYIVDALSTVEYLEGECVPCEVAAVKCTVRDGIKNYFHFFPDPGPLRPGHFAEALDRCELEHEIKPKDFPLASKDYEGDVTKLATLMRLNCPKTPLIFARSSEARKVESCLEWLGFRVDQEFKPKVMELESFIYDLVEYTNNTPPTFAQIRRLLFETKFDFVAGNRCDFHSQTDKIACSIGNIRKYLYFMSEILYDYYEFDIVEGHHFPTGYENTSAASRSSYSQATESVAGEDFSDTMSVASSKFSVGSYAQRGSYPHAQRGAFPPRQHGGPQPRRPDDAAFGKGGDLEDSMSGCNVTSPNSFGSSNSFTGGQQSRGGSNIFGSSSNPRRPNPGTKSDDLSYENNKPSGPNSFTSGTNSFAATPSTVRSMSPVPTSMGRGSPNSFNQRTSSTSSFNLPTSTPAQSFHQPVQEPYPSTGQTRARGFTSCPPSNRIPQTVSPISQPAAPSVGRGRGRGVGTVPQALPRRPNVGLEYGKSM